MAEKKQDASVSEAEQSVGIFPHVTIPTVFADGVTNFFHSREVAKFYLSRFDPSLTGMGGVQAQSSCQVVMPLSSFMVTAAFFKTAVEALVAQGVLNKDDWSNALEAQAKGFKFNG